MASQYGINRLYSSQDEATNPRKKQCDRCKVFAVPQGLATDHINPATYKGETYCPNCGHVHRAGRDNH